MSPAHLQPPEGPRARLTPPGSSSCAGMGSAHSWLKYLGVGCSLPLTLRRGRDPQCCLHAADTSGGLYWRRITNHCCASGPGESHTCVSAGVRGHLGYHHGFFCPSDSFLPCGIFSRALCCPTAPALTSGCLLSAGGVLPRGEAASPITDPGTAH